MTSAFALGLLHSLEPSHAKAVLASYFLDRRRTILEALVFAATVTVAHTLAIFLLAGVLYASGAALDAEIDERMSEITAGVFMVAVGAWMLWTEKRANFHRNEKEADHACGHLFHHHGYHHTHGTPSTLKGVFVLGFCSGSVPCMTGIAVLLQAWAIGSPFEGFMMLALFSLGLGIVVLGLSIATQQSAQLIERYWKGAARWSRFLPVISSVLILSIGGYVALTAFLE